MSSKSLVTFIKASHLFENVFKKLQNLSKSFTLLEKVSHHFIKASILQQMCLKSLAVFVKPLLNLKKAQFLRYL
jgi:hypothetical protein